MNSSQNASEKSVSWQRKMLPFMATMVGGLTLFFFLTSVFQLFLLHQYIREIPELQLFTAFDLITPKDVAGTIENRLELTQWKTLALLEAHALQRRHHQANMLLMARVWMCYLGFVTGMILSLVGATFILGKLRESQSSFEAQGPWTVSIATTSPGLILAILGTLLMLSTIIIRPQIELLDSPLYIPFKFLPPDAIQQTFRPMTPIVHEQSSPNSSELHLKRSISPEDQSTVDAILQQFEENANRQQDQQLQENQQNNKQ